MNVDPEIIGALVGIGGTLVLGSGGLIVRQLVKKNGNGTNGKARHCQDHYCIVEHLTAVRTDVEWIRKTLENGNGRRKNRTP